MYLSTSSFTLFYMLYFYIAQRIWKETCMTFIAYYVVVFYLKNERDKKYKMYNLNCRHAQNVKVKYFVFECPENII